MPAVSLQPHYEKDTKYRKIMPENKSAMTRYRLLDAMLGNPYRDYRMEDLNNECNRQLVAMGCPPVSLRQTQKDVHYLSSEMPGAVAVERYEVRHVSPDTGNVVVHHCMRYAVRDASVFKETITDEDRHFLSGVLDLFGQFDGLPGRPRIEEMRRKLGLGEYSRPVVCFTRNPLGDPAFFCELFLAIVHRVTVCLHYHVFSQPTDVRSVCVYPYQLREYNRRWFLVAGPTDSLRLLTFALDRLDRVDLCSAIPYREYAGDMAECFEDVVGVSLLDDAEAERIVFWASERAKGYVLTKPLHESQVHLRGTEGDALAAAHSALRGGAFFALDCVPNYELVRELCSFGGELVVLSPAGVRAKVVEWVRGVAEAYGLCGAQARTGCQTEQDNDTH